MDVTKAASQSHPKRKRRQSLASATLVFCGSDGWWAWGGGQGQVGNFRNGMAERT